MENSPSIDKQKLYNLIDSIINKYEKNDYILGRLTNYIENIIPSALENEDITHKQREERKQNLITNRDEFTARFLNINKYVFFIFILYVCLRITKFQFYGSQS